MIELYAVNIDSHIDDQSFRLVKGKISLEKRAKIERFRNFADAKRSLFGELVVRYLISRKLNIRNEEIIFAENDYGKPICMNAPNLHFNISHSANMIVCAIALHTPVGIDVEEIQAVDNSIIKHFFTHIEADYITKRMRDQQNEAFFRIWCAKESYLKALGKGLYRSLDSFSIVVQDQDISLKENDMNDPFWFQEYNISPQYITIVCGQSCEFAQIEFISSNELIDHFIYRA